MDRLTTDKPIGNTARAHNLFYIEEKETWVRNGDPAQGRLDERLYDHIRKITESLSASISTGPSDGELDDDLLDLLLDGPYTLEGLIAHYYTAAWAFSELRAHLKAYEDSRMPLILPEGQKTISAAIEAYGVPAQLDMAVEEMAELTKAICKRKRTGDTGPEATAVRENILEEMADVFIMLVQLLEIFDGAEEVQQTVSEKLDRLKARLERGGHPIE